MLVGNQSALHTRMAHIRTRSVATRGCMLVGNQSALHNPTAHMRTRPVATEHTQACHRPGGVLVDMAWRTLVGHPLPGSRGSAVPALPSAPPPLPAPVPPPSPGVNVHTPDIPRLRARQLPRLPYCSKLPRAGSAPGCMHAAWGLAYTMVPAGELWQLACIGMHGCMHTPCMHPMCMATWDGAGRAASPGPTQCWRSGAWAGASSPAR